MRGIVHLSILKIVVFVVLSAFAAVAAMFRDAFQTGKSPSDNGPRAVISEFCGFWAGGFLLLLAFTSRTPTARWCLIAVSAVVGISGLLLASHFAETTEVPETADKEPTGFKNNTTELHLE
jgi:hypothetical protein